MNNFDFKKYFGNFIGLPTTAPKKGIVKISFILVIAETVQYKSISVQEHK